MYARSCHPCPGWVIFIPFLYIRPCSFYVVPRLSSGRGISASCEKYTGSSAFQSDLAHLSESGSWSTSAWSDVLGAVLPGSGEPGPDCGAYRALHCKDCGTSFWGRRRCMSRLCPSCYELWARKEAYRASLRVWAAFRTGGGRLLHCVVSMPFLGHSEAHYRAEARRVAAMHGISGGLSIFHPFRDDGDGYGLDGYVHYHVVGIARGDVSPGGSDGVVIFKVVRDAVRHDYRGIARIRDARRLIQYLLTHCGLIEGRHPLTWWGCASYSVFSSELVRSMIPNYDAIVSFRSACPCCGSVNVVRCDVFDWTAGITVQAYPYPAEPPGVLR